MLIRNLAAAASVFALVACAGANADHAGADRAEADDKDHYALMMDGEGFHFSSHMSREDMARMHREINEEVRAELADARIEIKLALAEAQSELDQLHIDVDIDGRGLKEAVLMSVELALEEAFLSLEEVERQMAREEANMAMQAEHMAREAEQMEREAERMKHEAEMMKREAEAMKRAAERMKQDEKRLKKEAAKAPQGAALAPLPLNSAKSTPPKLAPAAGEPLQLRTRSSAPYIH